MAFPPYVLVTPARNEAKYIHFALNAVAAQTYPPERWIIVSDGSTDGTDDVVRDYAAKHAFIHLVRREPDAERNFGSKVRAIELGIAALQGIPYSFIGNMDGDVSMQPEYFEMLLARFEADSQIGVAGGIVHDPDAGTHIGEHGNLGFNVAGAVQMFRRACYEAIGGYRPLPLGGEDAVAGIMARMHGWKTQTFPDLHIDHHRRRGTEGRSVFAAFYSQGQREATIGYHPLFELAHAIRRMQEPPFVLGGVCHFAGFAQSRLTSRGWDVPVDCVKFLRREQLGRLRRLIGNHPDG